MNLATFRTRVRRVTGLGSDAADLALIDGWVNEGVVQFLKDTKLNTRMAALAVTGGQGTYTLDSDILSLQGVWYEPTNSDKRLLEPVPVETIFEWRLPSHQAYAGVRYYALSGAHTLMIWPDPPDSTDLLHILYVPRPAAMSNTADSPSSTAFGNIPEEYHPLIEAYAKWKGGEAEETKASDNGLQHQAEYERGVAKVRGELARKAGTVMPGVRIGRRPRGWPMSNGVDWGN